MSHHSDDECARFDIERELTVLGFDNPVVASDLQAGDIFQDPAAALSSRWYEVREVWEGDDRRTHLQIDDVSAGELAHARADVAHEKMLGREDAKRDPWR